jgi:uncharacterized membrane protein
MIYRCIGAMLLLLFFSTGVSIVTFEDGESWQQAAFRGLVVSVVLFIGIALLILGMGLLFGESHA